MARTVRMPFVRATTSALLFVLGVLASTSSALEMLDQLDTSQLNHVLKGGYPWLVLCNDGTAPIPGVFQEAASRLEGDVAMGVLDCGRQLASGKTLAEVLKLDLKREPTVFRVANGLAPVQHFAKEADAPSNQGKRAAVLDAKLLEKRVREATKPKVQKPRTTSDLAKECLRHKHRACMVLALDGKATPKHKEIIKKLVNKYRGIQFSVLNRERHLIAHDHLPSPGELADLGVSPAHPRALLFKPPSLNALSSSLAHADVWQQRLMAIPAAFGHGFGSELDDRLLRREAHFTSAFGHHSNGTDTDTSGEGGDGGEEGDDAGEDASDRQVPSMRVSLCRTALSGAHGGVHVKLEYPGVELSATEQLLFDQHEVKQDRFLEEGVGILLHPEAVFLVDGAAVDYNAAAPLLLSMSLYGPDIVRHSDFDDAMAAHQAPSDGGSTAPGSAHTVAHFHGPLSFKKIALWLEDALAMNDGMLNLSKPPRLLPLTPPPKPKAQEPEAKAGSSKKGKSKRGKGKKSKSRRRRYSYAEEEEEDGPADDVGSKAEGGGTDAKDNAGDAGTTDVAGGSRKGKGKDKDKARSADADKLRAEKKARREKNRSYRSAARKMRAAKKRAAKLKEEEEARKRQRAAEELRRRQEMEAESEDLFARKVPEEPPVGQAGAGSEAEVGEHVEDVLLDDDDDEEVVLLDDDDDEGW